MKGRDKMSNAASNEMWVNADNYDDFETTRPVLFRDDMREIFFKWFRIKPEYKVLDGGCGPGVLTRFIAKGLNTGKITGFDISKNFADYGNKKIAEENLAGKAQIVVEDGYNLSFAGNSFDTVVNHTYIGVLSDIIAGLKELIRVCKTGGTVSASCSSNRFTQFGSDSDCSFPGGKSLSELHAKYYEAYAKVFTQTELKQDTGWKSEDYPKLFVKCGLTNISMHPYASGFSYSDSYWSDEFKINKIKLGIGREIICLETLKGDSRFQEHGFTKQEFDGLIKLYKDKQDYLLNNLDDNQEWNWRAGTHYIVSGTKAI
jgi:ubiquinone/menaquinone biosynthesis C-methylase UbiE